MSQPPFDPTARAGSGSGGDTEARGFYTQPRPPVDDPGFPRASTHTPVIDSLGVTREGEPVIHTRARRKRRRSRHRRLWRKIRRRVTVAAMALGIVAGLILVLTLIRLERAESQLQTGKAEAESAAEAIRRQDLAAAGRHLAAAEDAFIAGRHTIDNAYELKIARLVPVVGRNLRTVSAMARSGSLASEAARTAVEAIRRFEGPRGTLHLPLSNGRIDLAAIESLNEPARSAMVKADAAVATIYASPSSGLLGPIPGARAELASKVTELRDALVTFEGYTSLLPSFLGRQGSRRYLVAVGNNSEMNANAMVLAFGILDARDGRLIWTRTGSVTELTLSQPAPVALPAEYMARWGWANPNFAWQRTNVSPDYPLAGETMAAMYREKTGERVDGVIYIDGVAVGYLMRATGPITFDDPKITLDDRNFSEFAMNRAYMDFPVQSERKEFLVGAAERVVAAALQISGEQTRTLGDAMGKAASERRLMAWSAHLDDQTNLDVLALGGKLPVPAGDFFSFTLENLSGNKLDYYIVPRIEYRSTIDSRGTAKVSVEIEIPNGGSAALPGYVTGADGARSAGRSPGDYYGYLTLYAPAGSYLTGGNSRHDVVSTLPDAGHAAFSLPVTVEGQGRKIVHLEYEVPDAVLRATPPDGRNYRFTYVPQPRFHLAEIDLRISFEGGSAKMARGFSSLDERTVAFKGNPGETSVMSAAWER